MNTVLMSLMAQKISACTGLLYLEDPAESEVCYVADSRLRPEYRQYFSRNDLKQYLASFAIDPMQQFPETVPMPVDASEFWRRVASCG